MLDAQIAAAAPPATVHRSDYAPPAWLVPEIALEFELAADRTLVRSTLKVRRNGAHDAPLRLDAEALEVRSVKVDGKPAAFDHQGEALTIPIDADEARVETEVEIAPEKNTQLMGLYASGGILCTQCEAE